MQYKIVDEDVLRWMRDGRMVKLVLLRRIINAQEELGTQGDPRTGETLRAQSGMAGYLRISI